MHCVVEGVVEAGYREEVDEEEDHDPFEEGGRGLCVIDKGTQYLSTESIYNPVRCCVESLNSL